MREERDDRWSRWLLRDRLGGDDEALRRPLVFLEPVRDRVIAGADIRSGSVVVDVGCGDGLLGFAAAEIVGDDGQVIFVDVSSDLVERCRHTAAEVDLSGRCRFLEVSAESLDGLADESVDAVLTRSVLIYVEDKQQAFDEFWRVLRPGGRISLFEPINRRGSAINRDLLFGYDPGPVAGLAEKIREVFEAANPPDSPMMNFDETDLLYLAEAAGFSDINVTVELSSTEHGPYAGTRWKDLMNVSPNPNAPTYGEAIDQALTPDEAVRFEEHLRPLVDGKPPDGNAPHSHTSPPHGPGCSKAHRFTVLDP